MNQKTDLKGITGFQEEETVAVSPWMLSLTDELGKQKPQARWRHTQQGFTFEIVEGEQSLWVVTRFPAGGEIALRAVYCPDGKLKLRRLDEHENAIELDVESTVGDFRTRLEFLNSARPLFRCTTRLTPSAPLYVPFWPRDVIPMGQAENLTDSEGVIYARQIGPRTGQIYFALTRPEAGAALYFQNLTALNDYAKQTETSLVEVVGGEWPELGLALPAATEKPLEAGKEITVSDAFMIFSPDTPPDDLVMAEQFLDFLAQIYLALPRPTPDYVHWPELLKKSLAHLSRSPKCWSTVKGKDYLNAYVGDYDTPPESMVQLTVLLPLLEYADWRGREIPITEDILKGLPSFYDEDAKVFARWLVSKADKLDGSEPQKKPEAMDSWYLYHSLLNLSRLAHDGDKTARKLFLDSMDYAIKVAHEFDYHWPVFYNLYTLEVIKGETEPGKGGETDVAGLYAHVMIQAWDLTKEERYLEEAKRAARSLKGLGFNLFYQANAVLFASGAMLRIWKETGDEQYRSISYLCLANIFNHMWLWECEYGNAQYYKTFFALFPLKDGPYTAVYEEIEGFAAMHDYLAHHEGEHPEWLRILAPEFIRVLLDKASYYYPPNLPPEIFSEEPRTGEIDPKLWIPLEDIGDGREKAGQVGQEVYGAGLPFGIVPRHYWRIPGEDFLLYIDYPTRDFNTETKGQATCRVLGDPRFNCRLRIIPTGKKQMPEFEVQTGHEGSMDTLKGKKTEEGHIEYELRGGSLLTVRWPVKGSAQNGRKQSKKGSKR